MIKAKLLVIPILLSFLLLPLGISYAQEDGDYTVTTQDDPVLYEDYESYTDEYVDEDMYYYEDYSEAVQENLISPFDTTDAVGTIGLMAGLAAYFVFIAVLGIGSYVFAALALQKIGKEMNYEKPWFAWIPILNLIMMMKLGNQNPWLLLIGLIPFLGAFVIMILMVLAFMQINEKRGYEKLLALLILVPLGMYILLYLLAWKPKTPITSQTPKTNNPPSPPVQQQ